jgi:GntR family transcriptional regulator
MQNIPKYFQIYRDITEAIRSGELQPGMLAWSENTIIQRYGVSNTTARQALREAESAGWVNRVKGRGTFVRSRDVERPATRILGFTRNMIESGHVPSSQVLEGRVIKTGYSANINGRLYNMPGPIFRLRRLRFADEVPMMVEMRYISMKFCPGIEKQNFSGSLYEIYENSYHIPLVEINQMLETIVTDPATRRLFALAESIPAFRVNGVTFCGKEMILEMEESIYRGDKYRFSVCAK